VSPVRYEMGFYIPEGGILLSHRRENLKCYIVFLYWEATHRNLQRLETLRTKRTKLLCTLPFFLRCWDTTTIHRSLLFTLRTKRSKLLCALPFLLRCRDHNTIPRFLQFRHHINSGFLQEPHGVTSQKTPFFIVTRTVHVRK
jgi:hypothetical protein